MVSHIVADEAPCSDSETMYTNFHLLVLLLQYVIQWVVFYDLISGGLFHSDVLVVIRDGEIDNYYFIFTQRYKVWVQVPRRSPIPRLDCFPIKLDLLLWF